MFQGIANCVIMKSLTPATLGKHFNAIIISRVFKHLLLIEIFMTRSAGVMLTDLNDYISPAPACTKPLPMPKVSKKGELGVEKEDEVAKPATITLNDCLACSGCITSAESVLISMHLAQELLNIYSSFSGIVDSSGLNNGLKKRVLVISVSPQSRASLAAKYEISQRDCCSRLTWFFRHFLPQRYFNSGQNDVSGFQVYLTDTTFSRDFSLLESAREFIGRYSEGDKRLPLLTSACPGWICYAEKTHGSDILPYISTTKSPQAVMGTLIKDYLPVHFSRHISPSPNEMSEFNREDVYHVSIMPCPDKKLEATRVDFKDAQTGDPDVDLVLTTTEVDALFQQFNLDFSTMEQAEYSSLFGTGDGQIVGTEGDSSGAYLDFVFHRACQDLFPDSQYSPMRKRVLRLPGKNSDVEDLVLLVDGEVKLRFGKCFGFRNIQNVIRGIKAKSKPASTAMVRRRQKVVTNNTPSEASINEDASGSLEEEVRNKLKDRVYDFVEIMACPSGCINGGGQLKPPAPSNSVSEWTLTSAELRAFTQRVESVYQSTAKRSPDDNSIVCDIYRRWLNGDAAIRTYLHTQYHAVADESSGLTAGW